MTDKTKNDLATVLVIVVIALALLWVWMRRKNSAASIPSTSSNPYSTAPSSTNPSNADSIVTPATAYWGSNGQPFAQGGTMDNMILNDIKIPVPEFGYSGNSQIYMPLFGFVGYSSVGTN